MKFAFILPTLAGGGAEKAVLKIAAGLSAKGHEARLILLGEHLEHMPPPGLMIQPLAKKLMRGSLGKFLLASRLRRMLAHDVDLVVSTLPFADEVAALARLPRHSCRIANTLGAEIDRLAKSRPSKARRRMARYRRLYHDRPLVAVSQGVANDLRHRFDCAKVTVIPNPFDFDAIRRAASEDFPRPVRPYVIHVGRFAPQKRHDLLLDAWARVDVPHELVLLSAYDPVLQAMIEQRGLQTRVRIAGFQANPYPWIAHADLLVLASDHEGLPNVLIEALICGTPVVSTDCPSGPREILQEKLGRWLVPCGEVAMFAEKIQEALATPPPSRAVVETLLAPYRCEHVLMAWEKLAEEIA
ncbi:MAG: glycosyltransferase [Rhodocyclaceae bacterium]|nr:glycosyltransferase [Rhodocyclaceae bacterium]